jgi:hypothetical protein
MRTNKIVEKLEHFANENHQKNQTPQNSVVMALTLWL